jgi:TATA-box binding protein (TBP) (component of TFIID and TFIIIB)
MSRTVRQRVDFSHMFCRIETFRTILAKYGHGRLVQWTARAATEVSSLVVGRDIESLATHLIQSQQTRIQATIAGIRLKKHLHRLEALAKTEDIAGTEPAR